MALVKSGDTGTNVLFYLDGVLDGTGSVSFTSPSGTKKIGGRYSYFKGSIDESAIWNRALSASEVASLTGSQTVSGTFTSTPITPSAQFFSLTPTWAETGSGTQLEVSFNNGTTWCVASKGVQLSNPNCAFPAASFIYRVNFTASTQLDSIRFDWANAQATTFTITASTGAGGTIAPTGTVIVNQGGSQTFTITPSTGYQIAGVLVNGSSVGVVSAYTFSSVQSNQTISASFTQTTQPPACGNNTLDAGETCDGVNLNNQTCATQGFASGNLTCNATCTSSNTGQGASLPPPPPPPTGTWVPPIGIPRPEFGIEETYRMYDNVLNRNSALTYTQNAEGGFYTHLY